MNLSNFVALASLVSDRDDKVDLIRALTARAGRGECYVSVDGNGTRVPLASIDTDTIIANCRSAIIEIDKQITALGVVVDLDHTKLVEIDDDEDDEETEPLEMAA